MQCRCAGHSADSHPGHVLDEWWEISSCQSEHCTIENLPLFICRIFCLLSDQGRLPVIEMAESENMDKRGVLYYLAIKGMKHWYILQHG
jgi:hypothetical protein